MDQPGSVLDEKPSLGLGMGFEKGMAMALEKVEEDGGEEGYGELVLLG